MRPDDHVIAFAWRGVARAYPLWVTDHYHVVNDRVGEQPVLVATCERCQSGAAFIADVPGSPERPPLFRAVGFLNATLLLQDLRTGSHWIHHEGRGITRGCEGLLLPWIPTYHAAWGDWLAWHPDSEVMLPPADPLHPDARHGHGREEFFARPGLDPTFVPTILNELDRSYPENAVVLGVSQGEEVLAVPLAEAQREGGVVRTQLGGAPLAVFAGPGPDGFTMGAYRPWTGDRELTFLRQGGVFEDMETASTWTIEGTAVDGPLAGSTLDPVRWSQVRWHAWIYVHPGTRLFRSERPWPAWPIVGSGGAPFASFLDRLLERGHQIELHGPVVSQLLPHEAIAGATVKIDGFRVALYRFSSERAARDFDSLEGAWSALPFAPRLLVGRTRRVGALVLKADPEDRYIDPAQLLERAEVLLAVSPLLHASDLPPDRPSDHERPGAEAGGAEVGGESPAPYRDVGFVELLRALRVRGYDIVDAAFLPRSQLRPGCVNGIALTLEADRFLLYRFQGPGAAAAYGASEPHAMVAGPLVLRSTPESMYLHSGQEIGYVGDERARWSELLDDARFVNTVRTALER
jgi:hypothetical protein